MKKSFDTKARSVLCRICGTGVLFATVACSQENTGGDLATNTPNPIPSQVGQTTLADTLTAVCPKTPRRGSVLVARPDPKEEESQVSFKLLGDGAGPGVVLCGDDLYADVAALLALMGEQATVQMRDGFAIIDSNRNTGNYSGNKPSRTADPARVPAYVHESVLYVGYT